MFVKRIWTVAPYATVMLAIAIIASVYFGVRSVIHPMRVEREQAVAAWMTPRYISRSWRVPPEVIQGVLGIPRPNKPVSLTQLAEMRGVPVAQVIAEFEAAIAAFRQNEPGADRND